MGAVATSDDRISPILKVALAAVVFVLFAAGIALVAFWMAYAAKGPEQKYVELKGMKIEAARQTADQAGVRLIVHEEYKENIAEGVIFQTDQVPGRPLRPGRAVNIWVSKGSRMVYVPDVTNLNKDDAERKIKEAGLVLGNVDRAYNDKIVFDNVISQNPRARKRVNRDTSVNLTISDGPKLQEPPPDNPPGENPNGSAMGENPGATGDSGDGAAPNGGAGAGASGETDSSRDAEVHSVNLTKKIARDGLGSRRVRIEYDDAHGTHQPIDEVHDEGETVQLRVDVYGPKVTVRVYYNDDTKPVSERTMTFKK